MTDLPEQLPDARAEAEADTAIAELREATLSPDERQTAANFLRAYIRLCGRRLPADHRVHALVAKLSTTAAAMTDQTPTVDDQQIDTLKARAERAEVERDDFQDQLGDLRASLSATEAEVDRLRADHPQGYAEAVARLRDDTRYTNWWMSGDCEPDGRIRHHLADYLEAVGPDGVDVETGRWPARAQAVHDALVAAKPGDVFAFDQQPGQRVLIVVAAAGESQASDPARGEFCRRHWSWLCQGGQGQCQTAGGLLPHDGCTHVVDAHTENGCCYVGCRCTATASHLLVGEQMRERLAEVAIGGIIPPSDKLPIVGEQPVDLVDRTVTPVRPARSTKFQSAIAGRPLDLVSFWAGSGRHYEGERSDSCPGDGIPGHRHDTGCIRPASAG